MRDKEEKKLVISDNLEGFSGKLLRKIIHDSEEPVGYGLELLPQDKKLKKNTIYIHLDPNHLEYFKYYILSVEGKRILEDKIELNELKEFHFKPPLSFKQLLAEKDTIVNITHMKGYTFASKLALTIKTAEITYEKPLKGWLGNFYEYTRKRGLEVKSAIKDVEHFHNTVTLLQSIKELISSGEWKTTSFNFLLFDELIKSIPGYEPLQIFTDPGYKNFIRIKELLLEKIDNYIKSENEKNARNIAAKYEELNKIQISREKEIVKDVFLDEINENAQAFAKQHKDKLAFSLYKTNGIWKLSWFDFLGKGYQLANSNELTEVLLGYGMENMSLDKEIKKNTIYIQLDKNDFSSFTYIIKTPNDQLISDSVAIASMEHFHPQYPLTIYDFYAIKMDILKMALIKEPALFANPRVNTIKDLNELELQKVKVECKRAMERMFATIQISINPLESNEQLISQGISRTFILRQQAHQVNLFWVDRLGGLRNIHLEHYEDLNLWLNKHPSLNEELSLFTLKTYLMYVNTSKPMDDAVQKRIAWLLEPPKPKEPLVVNKLNMKEYDALNRSLGRLWAPKVEEKISVAKKLNMNEFKELNAHFMTSIAAKKNKTENDQDQPGNVNRP